MIYLEKPKDFNPRFEIVSCFVEFSGEIVLLLRQDHKPEGNTWGVPAGKLEEKDLTQAVLREIREETSQIIDPKKISYFQAVYVRYPTYDFVYHIFHTNLEQKPEIRINPKEHKEYKLVSPQVALTMPLIQDLDACIELFYKT
ncbi:MAG: NUDIX hydrolase [Candidatus Pacearchaeota archaeon]|nr:NUDIX hydrolase [Candidatus Pacearchaeota archaeon]